MSKIFLCYASEDKATAEAIQLSLVAAGHIVFFDEQSLPAGGDYQRRIMDAIESCDVFVFLASPDSLTPGRFTLTEVEFARRRWPSPVDRVLPVLLRDVAAADLPPYLKAVTALSVHGNTAAEVRESVATLVTHRTRWMRWAGMGVGVTAALAACAFALWPKKVLPEPEKKATETTAAAVWTPMRGEIRLASDSGEFVGDGKTHVLADTNSVITAQVSDSTISVSVEGDEHWSLDFETPRGQSWRTANYPNAQRAAFRNPLKPGLDVSGAGHGCNQLEGEFVIRDVAMQPAAGGSAAESGALPQRLVVEFTQRCDGQTAALRGRLSLEATAR